MLNPQQMAFKEAYMNPESETFGNALQSGLKAGYSKEYSEVIGNQGTDWFSEIIGDLKLAQKAKEVLEKTLGLVDSEEAAKIKIAQDSAKFLGERVGNLKQKSEVDITSGGERIDNMSPAFTQAVKQFEETLKKSVLN